MTDDITFGDLETFLRALGFPRITPALRNRIHAMVTELVGCIEEMNGPGKKRIGDAIAEQTKWLVQALEMDVDVPERDMVGINRV